MKLAAHAAAFVNAAESLAGSLRLWRRTKKAAMQAAFYRSVDPSRCCQPLGVYEIGDV
jgi:hypothetical protein